MRASTLFALTIALLLALGVAVAAKYSGFFDSAPPPVAKQSPTIQILVAGQNLFEGMTISGNEVRVRDLREGEYAHYQANRDKYLPPILTAANYRILARNVLADQPLLKDDFQEFKMPAALHARLRPFMRAVSVSILKDRASGGMLQVGERVDVLLTTQINPNNNPGVAPIVETAVIARDVRIIAKRNSLWTMMAPLPENQPIQFTLEANPYRATLIEFARLRGELTLVATAAPKLREVEAVAKGGRPVFSDPENREYKDEDQRVDAVLANDLTVGDLDLERIFNLKPLPPAPQPYRVERYSDISPLRTAVFASNGNGPSGGVAPAVSIRSSAAGNGYRFSMPGVQVASAASPPPGGG